MPQGFDDPQLTRGEVLDYIRSHAGELARMADGAGLRLVAYLLRMVAEEARASRSREAEIRAIDSGRPRQKRGGTGD